MLVKVNARASGLFTSNSFIHSFILNIYIAPAPLEENYSEALPTPAWLKRAVLR